MRIAFRKFAVASLGFVAFFVTGCHEEPSAQTDAEMKERIIGTWVVDDGPFSLYYMEKTYSTDGTSAGFLLNRQTGKRIDFTSRWQIKDGHYTGQVVKSSNPALPQGASFSTQILGLTGKRFVTMQDGSGRITVSHRKGRFALF